MTILHSIILGIIEGVTEFLPISSTGHMILASSLLGITPTDFSKNFEIAIQLGAILAVVVIFWKKFWNWDRLFKLAVAFIPTGIIGLLLYHVVKQLLGSDVVVLASLFVGGIILIAFERYYGKRENALAAATSAETPASDIDVPDMDKISYPQAIGIGFAQAVAIIPGVSRSGATIVGGMAMGISRAAIVEFSFLLAVPTMLAATLYSLYKSHAFSYTSPEWTALAIGFVVAFLVAMPIVKWFLDYVRKHSFTSFGIYRILLSLVFAAWLFL
jgi:undecaprenyl-diphosphatase